MPRGVHPQAWVSPQAKLGENVSIGAFAVVEAGAEIGAGTTLYPQTYVGHEAKLGADCLLYPFASVRERCVLGDRVILQNGAVIGADGFGYAVDAQGVRTKIPQTGIVVLEDDVEIGANATVDRARFGQTRVGKGTKVDNLVMIAHNCIIGEHSVLCSQVGLAGTTTLGKHVICAGQAGLAGTSHGRRRRRGRRPGRRFKGFAGRPDVSGRAGGAAAGVREVPGPRGQPSQAQGATQGLGGPFGRAGARRDRGIRFQSTVPGGTRGRGRGFPRAR